MRGKGNRRERRDSNCCEMKGKGGGEGRVEGGGWRGKQDGAVYVNITRCHGGQSNHWYVHELSNSANCAYHFIPFYLHNTLCGVL